MPYFTLLTARSAFCEISRRYIKIGFQLSMLCSRQSSRCALLQLSYSFISSMHSNVHTEWISQKALIVPHCSISWLALRIGDEHRSDILSDGLHLWHLMGTEWRANCIDRLPAIHYLNNLPDHMSKRRRRTCQNHEHRIVTMTWPLELGDSCRSMAFKSRYWSNESRGAAWNMAERSFNCIDPISSVAQAHIFTSRL